MPAPPVHLRLPATSANLGPGFDALGLALDLWLEIDAAPAQVFAIDASGRDASLVASLERNLLLSTYREVAPLAPSLHLRVRNGIPLGMGCGSSAAALLAGVALANHFGALGLTPEQVLAEACRREGHPDNVAACFHGGLTASAMIDGEVIAASFGQRLDWRFVLVLPQTSLSTAVARGLLPERYTRQEAVDNVQATALLVSAFALDRPDLLWAGTRDRLHQPFRAAACPLVERLAPLARRSRNSCGVHAVTLSGAGPAALVWARRGAAFEDLTQAIGAELSVEMAREDMPTLIETGIAQGFSMNVDISV